ncbi:MAG: helix-turn-helix domain-containing protein [archaeon]
MSVETTKLLEDIGLTNSEAKVYIALLDLGETTVGPVAKKAEVAYSKIHLLLEKLIEKGLVSYIVKDKTKHFFAASPKKILEYLEKKRTDFEKQALKTKSLITELEKKVKIPLDNERIELYEGVEGLSTIYNEGLDTIDEKKETVVLGAGGGGALTNDQVNLFLKKVNQKRLKKKINYRLIYNETLRNDPEIIKWTKMPYTKVKFLMNDTPGSVNVRGDRTMIIYWHKDMPKVFFIKSQPVANSFRQYFEVIWNVAKE